MRRILAIAAHDIRRSVTSAGTVVSRLLIPVALIFVVGVANGAFEREGPPVLRLDVHDLDESRVSRFAMDFLIQESGSYTICARETGPCSPPRWPDTRLGEENVVAYLVLPDGLERSILLGDEAELTLMLGNAQGEESAAVESLAESLQSRLSGLEQAVESTRQLARVSDAEAAEAALGAAVEFADNAGPSLERRVLTVEDEAELEGFRQSVPGMGSMFVMLTVLAGAGLLVEERKRRTLDRVLASPTRRSEVIFGKILGRFVMGLAQFGVAVLTGVVLGRLFGVGFGSSPVIFLVVMGAFVFFASALTLFLATLAENSTQASAFSTLVAVTLAPLGGAWWSLDLEFIPEIMRALARVSPFYWAMQGFRAAILNAGWPPALPGVLVLLAAGLVFFVIASLRLGRKLGER